MWFKFASRSLVIITIKAYGSYVTIYSYVEPRKEVSMCTA